MNNPNYKIYCVIPAFNEAGSIAAVIQSVKPYVYDIIVVDDCSADNTGVLAEEQGVIVLKHAINRGQGAALQTGNEYARLKQADIVVHFDADGQFSAAEIPEIIRPLVNENYDAALGSRFLEKKSNLPWFKEKIIMPLGRTVNKTLFNINLSDPQNGFRALSAKSLELIAISSDGSAHCSEIIFKLFQNNLKVKEVPVTVTYDEFGQGIFGGQGRRMGGVRILKDLLLTKLID